MNFSALKQAIQKQFERLSKHKLVRVNLDLVQGEETISTRTRLANTYLASFPEGTDPIFRERSEHNCNCCLQFIRTIGNVGAIINGKFESIWDVKVPSEPGYQVVVDAMSALVHSAQVSDIFLHYENTVGVDKSFEELVTGIKTWEHFSVRLPHTVVVQKADIPGLMAVPRDLKQVLLRSLLEITDGAVETVLELIAQNSLYRGAEKKYAVTEFAKLKAKFAKLATAEEQNNFAWTVVLEAKLPDNVMKIRGDAIGTLLVNISEGKDLEHAVKAWETIMAPANYQRPTAIITQKMIDQAKVTLNELGLTSALERRYANLNDITIDNLLFADRSIKVALSANPLDDLAPTATVSTKGLDKIEEVGIERFLKDILPLAKSIEVLLDGAHAGNFVSLIAPVDPTAGQLFKWNNGFSWSYTGDVADSIKERVKSQGGNVTGDLCCRLAWDYSDDLDFHMREPGGGHIYYGNFRRSNSPCGGQLDLDANGVDGLKPEPAENIFYSNKSKMREGTYTLSVNNFNRRSDGKGFTVEIEADGEITTVSYPQVIASGRTIEVASINYSKRDGFKVTSQLAMGTSSREIWGLKTQQYHRVTAIMKSPNFWDGQLGIGNEHIFFMLEGCVNDGKARGFYNEFLSTEMTKHRKVLEVVGSKMKTDNAEAQLSGIGFSTTQKNSLICRIGGSFTRVIKLVF
jgi:hypothetical protein